VLELKITGQVITSLVYNGADLNYTREEIIPSRYFHKTTYRFRNVNGQQMGISYKLPKAYICQNKVYMPEIFYFGKRYF